MAPAAFAAPVAPYSDGALLPVVERTASAASLAPESLGGSGSGITAAGNWLLSQQLPNSGFPWTPGGTVSEGNVQGPIAGGLVDAYEHSGVVAFKTDATETGNLYITAPYLQSYTDGDPRFSTYDPLFLEQLSIVTGDPQYAAFAGTYFWSKLAAGKYGETDDLDAAEWAALVTSNRTSQGLRDLVPWDIGAVAIGAQVAGETATRDAVMAEILTVLNATTTPDDFDILGLAGAVWAADVTGTNLDPASGPYESINSTAGLAAELATFQYESGSWASGTSEPAPGDWQEAQTTAFALLALDAVDPIAYKLNIAKGAAFLRSLQDTNGEILSYPEAATNYAGSNETHAEALTALVAVAPSVVYVDDSWTGMTAGTDPDGEGPALAYGYDAFAIIAEGLDAVTAGGTVNVAAGTYDVATTMVVNRAVTISGPTSGIAKLQGTNSAAVSIFEIAASNVTIQNLEITHNALTPGLPSPWAELPNSLIRIPAGSPLSGIVIKDNKIYVPLQTGAMSTWNGVAITVGAGPISGISITGNTIHNTRNGVVVHSNNTATLTNNVIYNTKGGIMNYTGSQADADHRTMLGNTWGTVHNEWDIVWNSGSYYLPPDRSASVLGVSASNSGAYVLDLRAADAAGVTNLTGNRSHIFVDAASIFTVQHRSRGNVNEPFQNLDLAWQAVIPGGTVYVFKGGTYDVSAGAHPGGVIVTANTVTINLNGATVNAGSPAFTIFGDDVTIIGPGTLDGDHTDPAVLVQAGADNFTLQDVEVKNWEDGVQVAGPVISLKIVNNYIHENDDAGLQVDAGATLSGVVTVEGNLLKANGGNGIESAVALEAEYNSWGDVGGPGTGDGVSASVDADPWTFAETYIDVDPTTTGDQFTRGVVESVPFDVEVRAEAVNLYGFSFKLSFSADKLVKNSVTLVASGCSLLDDLAENEVGYSCYATTPWDGGPIATINFTAQTALLTGPGPWTALLGVDHVASTAGTANGAKVYLNNVKLAGLTNDRDITDANDGEITITGIAQYTGFIDVQGRSDDSGAVLDVFAANTLTGSVLATATSAKSGAYTTAGTELLTIGTTYYVFVDKPLYLRTRVEAAYVPGKQLTTRPLTTLSQLVLKGGDANDNEEIDINDAGCIGGAYGSAPGLCGSAGSTDVNGDGKVDILDLTLMGGNYGLKYSAWTP